MRSHLLIVDLSDGAVEEVMFCSGSCLLCQWVQVYSPLSLLLDSVYLVICRGLWSAWTWVLCQHFTMALCIAMIRPGSQVRMHVPCKSLWMLQPGICQRSTIIYWGDFKSFKDRNYSHTTKVVFLECLLWSLWYFGINTTVILRV